MTRAGSSSTAIVALSIGSRTWPRSPPKSGTRLSAGGLFVMERNPTCPNCGRVMKLLHEPKDPDAQHSFQCRVCHVVYLTHDHEPVHQRVTSD